MASSLFQEEDAGHTESRRTPQLPRMIIGHFHQGSGLGNQLFRYVMTRTIALDKGFPFAMVGAERFKGASFMSLDMGQALPDAETLTNDFGFFTEKKVVENGVDIRGYDPEVNFVNGRTLIDGEFQDERYWGHNLEEIDQWLKVEPLAVPDDTCVIGFRGGEYAAFPDLYLTREYWDRAIAMFPGFKFEVHTDDPVRAKEFFPDYPIIADIALNWRAMRYAKYAIIANSSFYILPRILSGGETVAPRYWARRNTGVWALPQNYYPEFQYI